MRRHLLQLQHLHGCSWIVMTPTNHARFTLISEMTKELAKISQLAAQSHPWLYTLLVTTNITLIYIGIKVILGFSYILSPASILYSTRLTITRWLRSMLVFMRWRCRIHVEQLQTCRSPSVRDNTRGKTRPSDGDFCIVQWSQASRRGRYLELYKLFIFTQWL